MFDKKMMKKMALKSLMEMFEKEDDIEGKPKMKATIMADSEEGLIEGAKKLPEVLSKSEEYMKKRMSELDKSKKDKKKK